MTQTSQISFRRNEEGVITALGLFFLLTFMVVGGLAIDIANAYKTRTELQAAADNIAHAALYNRSLTSDPNIAKNAALDIKDAMVPNILHGNAISANNIQFGHWDPDTNSFSSDPNSNQAVFVDIARLDTRGNSLGTFFLRFAGFNSFDVRRGTVYETYYPTCFREGMVAHDMVDLQSNNEFVAGFCIHSNDHVSLNIDNDFEDGTIVSMPDKRDLDLPSDGFTKNPGLSDALRDGSYQLRVLNQLPAIIADLAVAGSNWTPAYITSTVINNVTGGGGKDMTDFAANQVNTYTCTGNARLTIQANTILEDVVIVTNCEVKIGNNVELRDATIATTNTGAESINGSHVTIGLDDDCADGGSGSILTLGGISFSSDLNMYGGQMIALGDIYFRARANGIEGASIIAGGSIDTASLIGMGFCGGDGMGDIYEAAYFRMVQ